MNTFLFWTRSCAAVVFPLFALDWSSTYSTSSLRPFTPPLAFSRSTARLAALIGVEERGAGDTRLREDVSDLDAVVGDTGVGARGGPRACDARRRHHSENGHKRCHTLGPHLLHPHANPPGSGPSLSWVRSKFAIGTYRNRGRHVTAPITPSRRPSPRGTGRAPLGGHLPRDRSTPPVPGGGSRTGSRARGRDG